VCKCTLLQRCITTVWQLFMYSFSPARTHQRQCCFITWHPCWHRTGFIHPRCRSTRRRSLAWPGDYRFRTFTSNATNAVNYKLGAWLCLTSWLDRGSGEINEGAQFICSISGSLTCYPCYNNVTEIYNVRTQLTSYWSKRSTVSVAKQFTLSTRFLGILSIKKIPCRWPRSTIRQTW